MKEAFCQNICACREQGCCGNDTFVWIGGRDPGNRLQDKGDEKDKKDYGSL